MAALPSDKQATAYEQSSFIDDIPYKNCHFHYLVESMDDKQVLKWGDDRAELMERFWGD